MPANICQCQIMDIKTQIYHSGHFKWVSYSKQKKVRLSIRTTCTSQNPVTDGLGFIFVSAEYPRQKLLNIGLTKQLPLEATVYWIQHLMMFIVPYYLFRLGGAYNVEDTWDFHWNTMAYSLLVAYHFTVLQGVSLLTNVNMNHIMCPLEEDPFRGQLHRTAVFFHEGVLCPLVCKTYICIGRFFIGQRKYTKIKDSLE